MGCSKRCVSTRLTYCTRASTRPEIPLHNNGTESDILGNSSNAARSAAAHAELQRSRRCRDRFASLKKTCRKLGVRFWDYLQDRVRGLGHIPRLADLIRQKAREAATKKSRDRARLTDYRRARPNDTSDHDRQPRPNCAPSPSPGPRLIEKLPSHPLLRILPRRQRRRAGGEPSDWLDWGRGQIHPSLRFYRCEASLGGWQESEFPESDTSLKSGKSRSTGPPNKRSPDARTDAFTDCFVTRRSEDDAETLHSVQILEPISGVAVLVVRGKSLGAEGLEPLAISTDLTNILSNSERLGAAKSGAFFTEKLAADPDLIRLVEAWPALPEAVRTAILDIIQHLQPNQSPRKDNP